MPALATKLVNKFAGADGTSKLIVTTPGAYNQLDGTTGADTVVETVTDVSPPVPVSKRMAEDINAVLMGDFVTWIDGPQLTLTKAMINHAQIEYLGIKYKLVWFNDLKSGANTAAYEVFVRNV
jgi:hypothetical protein